VGPGVSPLDERLGLRPGIAFAPALVEDIVLLGAWLPFERVPAALAHFTGVCISVETARRLTEGAGAVAAALVTAEVAAVGQSQTTPPAGPACQLLSADGAFVPLVGGAWGEVKTLALGTVILTADGSPATTALSYFSRLADAPTFGDLATSETWRRGTLTADTVVAVADGAPWIQDFVDLQRPDAVRILDFPHAVEHLALAAQAVFGPGTEQTSAWLGEQAHALRHGQETQALAALAALGDRAGLTGEAQTIVAQQIAYFAPRADAIRYARFTRAGYPIGSGCVESANKLVVEQRLKGSGMHWARANVNPLLELRTTWANGRWDERWPALWQAWCRRPAPAVPASADPPPADTAPPAPASPPTRSRPKRVVDGKPTADHPWRAFTFGRAKR
jgi:hypothetical protein